MEGKDSTNCQIKDEWKQIIANKRILLIYSEENLDTAAEIVRCLRSLGAIVNYKIAWEASFSGQPGNIYYTFNDFEVATAIQSATVKIKSFRLNSTGFDGRLIIFD